MPAQFSRSALTRCQDCRQRSTMLFCDLHAEALEEFNEKGMRVQLPTGATLFYEDELPDGVFILCSGLVKLSCTSKQGKTLILRIAHPGDLLALGAVLSGTRLEVTAETLEPTIVKKINSADFLELLDHHSEAGLHAARTLSAEYKSAFVDVRRLALSGSAAGRLASVLLNWGKSSTGKTEMTFKMALTHEDLASVAGTSRETVTRLLGRFQKDDLIRIRGASISILSPDRLEQLCS